MSNRNIQDTKYLQFLAGFVEGEGSMSVSVSVHRRFKYGVNIQPVFNVTQHKNGIALLNSYKELFEVGQVTLKSGSPDIFVYTIKGYKNIIKSVLPFLDTYLSPFSCKMEEYSIFKQVVLESSEGKQRDKESLINLVKLSYQLEGKGKNRKRSLSEVLDIIEDKNKHLVVRNQVFISDDFHGFYGIPDYEYDSVQREIEEYSIYCMNKDD